MDVERHNLPGIGMQHVITTRRGRRLGDGDVDRAGLMLLQATAMPN